MISRWLFALTLATISAAQAPPSATLSEGDAKLVRAEIDRLTTLAASAAEPGAIDFQIARIWASAGQWQDALMWLGKTVDRGQGFDPSRDSLFAPLRGTPEFEAMLKHVREATPRITRSTPAFRVAESGLVPESMAYDPAAKQFYFGSMRKGEILRCTGRGECETFAQGLGVILGLKVGGGSLWVLDNSDTRSALLRYDLASGKPAGEFAAQGKEHAFNDLTIAGNGDIYLTDTRAGAIWRLAQGASALTRVPGAFTAANGITASPDSKLLYVSTFSDGITLIDLASGAAVPIPRPAGITLALVDGLYFHDGSLIAIQNGFMTPRVVRFPLSRDLRVVERLEILERRNPLFDGVTTGVLVGRDFFYMANIQDEKSSGFRPITILKLHL